MRNLLNHFVIVKTGEKKPQLFLKNMSLLFILQWKKPKLFIQKFTHIPENTYWSQMGIGQDDRGFEMTSLFLETVDRKDNDDVLFFLRYGDI